MKAGNIHLEAPNLTKEKSCRVEFAGKLSSNSATQQIPLYLHRISAGFPSPADDYLEASLDLNTLLVRNPPSTFMVSGESMIDAGIQDGDILVVDRSEMATHGKIVVVALDGEMTVKRLHLKGGLCKLVPENKAFKPILINKDQDLQVWGVVVGVVRKI